AATIVANGSWFRRPFAFIAPASCWCPSPSSSPNPSHRWTREQIRGARQVPLVPLLQKRGLQLIEKEASNFELPAFPGLIVKESYRRWPQRNLAGNTIDFFVQVLEMTFHNAMRQITGS